MQDDEIKDFWKRLKGINAGLLGHVGGPARLVPMSHQLRDGDDAIWFITGRDTDLVRAVESGDGRARYVVADGGKGLYAVLTGQLSLNDDKAVLDDLWSVVADSWFDGGKDDPDVRVLAFTPDTAEVWLTPTSGLTFAFGILRAQLTGEQPDMGSHATLSAAQLVRSGSAA